MGFAPMTTTIPAQRFQHAFFLTTFLERTVFIICFFQRAHAVTNLAIVLFLNALCIFLSLPTAQYRLHKSSSTSPALLPFS